MQDLARLFSVLSEPSRLRALALLLEHAELCACALSKTLLLGPTKTGALIRSLESRGLVETRREREAERDCLFVRLASHERLGADQRLVVSMLRCLLPGERAAEIERRFEAWDARRKQTGTRCVVCCCKKAGCGRRR